MTQDRVRAVLTRARDRQVFSAAAWSHGDAAGPWSRGILGTVSWDGADADEDSHWDLASVTKPIVAMAVMSAVERGELSLQDTIGDLLPDYPADKGPITVRQLLTHTSGLPGQVPLFRWNPTADSLLAAVRALPLLGEPDRAVVYSSQGFMVLGLIAEAASGRRLDDLVTERVLAPAAMLHSSFGLAPDLHARAVATEDDPWRGRVVQGEVHDENAVVIGRAAGHAGVFATLADLEKLGSVLCRQDGGEDGPVLSAATQRAMVQPRTDHLDARWTLGWAGAGDHTHGTSAGDLISSAGYGHTGFTGTSLWVDPTSGRYSILLTNRVHPSRETTGITRVRRLVNNIAFGSPAAGAD